MEITLENQFIKAVFSSLGAETIGVFDKRSNTELLWQGEKGVYTDRSPNLFPMIGRLKKGRYTHEGREYDMALHGFAKDSGFILTKRTEDSVEFLLAESPETLKVYPFNFNFTVNYALADNRLITSYTVKNTGGKTMYFGLGGHPGFSLPCKEEESGTAIDGSSLIFEYEEKPERILLDPSEILITGKEPYGPFKEIPLSKSLFCVDALLFKGLKSGYAVLSRADGVRVKFNFKGCPYLAFWSHKKRGGFVCFEPWCGLPDNFKPAPELKDKEGINPLSPGTSFNYSYEIETC